MNHWKLLTHPGYVEWSPILAQSWRPWDGEAAALWAAEALARGEQVRVFLHGVQISTSVLFRKWPQ